MKISRRKFLGAAPVVGGALLLNGSLSGQKRDSGSTVQPALAEGSLSYLTWDSFYPFIYTSFKFGRSNNAVSLKLVDMTDSRPFENRHGTSENFVLKFQGPFNKVLVQNTYKVNHFNLGDFDLFITDGGRVGKEQYYIAVINRIIE